MKILKFKDFVQLPKNTIFSYYEPSVTRGLYIKGDSIVIDHEYIDYFEQNLIPEKLFNETFEIDIKSRWGEFDFDQEYVVFETKDIENLKTFLGVI